ncbi:hypothetical protein Caci_7569 [Catenulispora acidiphila DSM 44928]|uniref:Uncharacterized protein n=1 Tax=Catenulispora acidiphila (strain DSM 44928 / JCM 14897 / NBRC 102108 / NRRL B-24433 / ID139908) TaxID=479433 RepID=C7QBA2_CATAD|nr:hypothetical protein [Catenulispora acidiphila]ACU76393.1 hypothetical protein Caci_7569 [Catenulispora acidiphila DSM 44928]
MVAGLVDAVHFAGRDDAWAVLRGLGEAGVAEGIAGASLPLCVAVSDFVLEEPSSATAVALARRALADETVADPDTVLRALIRLADPVVDEALVRTEGKRPRAWVLAALVRDRRGADGRPVIAPGIEQFLRGQLVRATRRHAGRDNPTPARVEAEITRAACYADDADLVATALPLAMRFQLMPPVMRGLLTLRDHGLLSSLWEGYGGLREVATTVMATSVGHYGPWWEPVLAFGDTGDDAALVKAPRRLRTDRLPPAHDADSWTRPNIGSQHYEMPWDAVLEYAALVGKGEEGTQAGQATSRGLDEAAAREDVPQDVRATFEERYPRAVFWSARPDIETLRRAHDSAERLTPATRHFATRELLRRGLLHGSLSAKEAVAHAEPAAELLALALPTPPGLAKYYTAKGKNSFAPHFVHIPAEADERYQAELRTAVAEAIGTDPARWLKVLTRVAAWEGSLATLLDAVDAGEPLPQRRGSRWPRGVDPAAVLLEVAPEGLVAALQEAAGQSGAKPFADNGGLGADPAQSSSPESRALTGVLTRILDRGPAPRWLLDLAVGPHGTFAMRLAAARNPAATVGTLWRLADREPAEPGVLAAVYLHPLASLELRIAAVVRSETAGGLYPGLVRRLVTRYAEPALLQPALESHDPELLHSVLRRSNRSLQTDRRVVGYAHLAAAAGPEPVWALELERAGSLERMHEAVRASMSSHNDEPLQAAAAGIARPDPERITELWDAGFQQTRPDTADRVRKHLDGRPERWLRLAEPGTTLHGMLAELEGGEPHVPQPRRDSDTPAPPIAPPPTTATPTPRDPKPRLSQTPSLLPPLPRNKSEPEPESGAGAGLEPAASAIPAPAPHHPTTHPKATAGATPTPAPQKPTAHPEPTASAISAPALHHPAPHHPTAHPEPASPGEPPKPPAA